jgi:hypothetical protein
LEKEHFDSEQIADFLAEKKAAEHKLLSWNYGGLDIFYYDELDGGGRFLAKPFADFIKNFYGKNNLPGGILECCCGPAFIGFALLAEGLCDRLFLSDINPAAIECVNRTIAENSLSGKVECYVSDNFKSIPQDVKVDLMVSNPPNYYSLNPEHPFYKIFKDDIKPNDPGWSIHREFYKNAAGHLNGGGNIFISEVEPHKKEVFIPWDNPVPFDVRPDVLTEDFRKMIEDGGLRYIDTVYFTSIGGGVEEHLMISRKA